MDLKRSLQAWRPLLLLIYARRRPCYMALSACQSFDTATGSLIATEYRMLFVTSMDEFQRHYARALLTSGAWARLLDNFPSIWIDLLCLKV